MDTLIAMHQIIIDTFQLHSLNNKLAHIQDIVEKKPQIPSISIWVPFLSSIAGGLLVWLGQFIERKNRRTTEKNNTLLEIYAYCVKLEAEMKNNYRELAMAKVHVEYWWHCCNSPSSRQQDVPRYYEEHLRSQSYAREIEKRIGETKAAYIAHVRKFQALVPIQAERQLETIANLKNPKAKRYEFSIPHEKLREELVEKDESELWETYNKNLSSFKQINDHLQSAVKNNYK